jgi:hypothetical protein
MPWWSDVVKKYTIRTHKVQTSIQEPVTTLGGQPVWIEQPQWQLRDLSFGEFLCRHHDEVDIAMTVEVPDCERSLQIGTDEVDPEHDLHPIDQVLQHLVQVGKGRGSISYGSTS